jgi:hypothetical protein
VPEDTPDFERRGAFCNWKCQKKLFTSWDRRIVVDSAPLERDVIGSNVTGFKYTDLNAQAFRFLPNAFVYGATVSIQEDQIDFLFTHKLTQKCWPILHPTVKPDPTGRVEEPVSAIEIDFADPRTAGYQIA